MYPTIKLIIIIIYLIAIPVQELNRLSCNLLIYIYSNQIQGNQSNYSK